MITIFKCRIRSSKCSLRQVCVNEIYNVAGMMYECTSRQLLMYIVYVALGVHVHRKTLRVTHERLLQKSRAIIQGACMCMR